MLEKGIITKEELNPMRFKAFFGEFNLKLVAEEFCIEYENNLADEYFFVDGAEDMLASLYGNYRLYIASNGYKKTQYSRIEKSGIQKNFDDVFVSQEIGFDKPSADFFNVAFSRIPDFKREETVIIGDSLTSDIRGGKNAGIKTIWFNKYNADCGDIIPDFEVKSLDEINDIIKRIG